MIGSTPAGELGWLLLSACGVDGKAAADTSRTVVATHDDSSSGIYDAINNDLPFFCCCCCCCCLSHTSYSKLLMRESYRRTLGPGLGLVSVIGV